ncbi:SDR family NAD(P)-dependent oxidoreductase [Kineosporia babensis]|nr:SDR family NAD(P)-dependent oxidoreductase [Kineosporia babensis]
MQTATTTNRYGFGGKTVLVTGAGSGMGRAIARGFLANGARVVVTGRRPEPLGETVRSAQPGRALVVPGDVADRDHIREALEKAEDHFGGLDVVVSNAGAIVAGDIVDLQESAWERMRSTNLDAFYRLSSMSLPMLARRGGNLVAVASVSGLNGDWGQAAYNATKHAVVGFVRSLALDWGSRGVRVNAIAPSFTLTGMTAPVGTPAMQLQPFNNRIALRRPGRPEDVVGATLFLASSDAQYITGAVVPVDGGTGASTGQPHLE